MDNCPILNDVVDNDDAFGVVSSFDFDVGVDIEVKVIKFQNLMPGVAKLHFPSFEYNIMFFSEGERVRYSGVRYRQKGSTGGF